MSRRFSSRELFVLRNHIPIDTLIEEHLKLPSKFSEEFYILEPDKSDKIFTKNSYDAFTNPELDKYLKRKKIKNLIIAGVLGDGCIDATIKGGFSKGYNFIILKDLIETMDDKDRRALSPVGKRTPFCGNFFPNFFKK